MSAVQFGVGSNFVAMLLLPIVGYRDNLWFSSLNEI